MGVNRATSAVSKSIPTRKWWQYVGPWPIQPALLTVFVFLSFLAYQAGRLGSTPLLSREGAFESILPGALTSILVYVIAKLGQLWQRGHGIHWVNYLVTFSAISGMALILRMVGFIPDEIDGARASIFIFVRFMETMMLISAVAGAVTQRLRLQIQATQEALRISGEQQVQIIQSDEEARRQVALLLHDRVQSRLLTMNLELRALAKRLPEAERQELARLIEGFEIVRDFDVRRAAHVLSPNLDDVDLRTALEELATQYEAGFFVDIRISREVESELPRCSRFIPLAIYRIVEQALINVAAHAHATSVVIAIEADQDGFVLTIEDNGVGIQENTHKGLGSTIITTWIRAVGGEWSLSNSGSGAVLTAYLSRSTEVSGNN